MIRWPLLAVYTAAYVVLTGVVVTATAAELLRLRCGAPPIRSTPAR